MQMVYDLAVNLLTGKLAKTAHCNLTIKEVVMNFIFVFLTPFGILFGSVHEYVNLAMDFINADFL